MAAIEYDRWFCTCGFEFTLSGEGGLCPHRRDGREHKTVKEAYVTLPAADYRGGRRGAAGDLRPPPHGGRRQRRPGVR
jgi:hypothetical protein